MLNIGVCSNKLSKSKKVSNKNVKKTHMFLGMEQQRFTNKSQIEDEHPLLIWI
jgi:hypothetical protein